MLDPGIGFAKNHLQNIEIIKKISVIQELNYPLLIGPSRKSFIGQILNKPNPETRIFGTAAVVAWLSIHNVDCVRVHDITEMKEVITIIESIRKIE
jgi:dihydropteroate synthase